MFKTNQVLRTNRSIPLTVEGGPSSIPSNTRVVVVSSTSNSVNVKVADPARKELAGLKFESGASRFNTTKRGRPKKDA